MAFLLSNYRHYNLMIAANGLQYNAALEMSFPELHKVQSYMFSSNDSRMKWYHDFFYYFFRHSMSYFLHMTEQLRNVVTECCLTSSNECFLDVPLLYLTPPFASAPWGVTSVTGLSRRAAWAVWMASQYLPLSNGPSLNPTVARELSELGDKCAGDIVNGTSVNEALGHGSIHVNLDTSTAGAVPNDQKTAIPDGEREGLCDQYDARGPNMGEYEDEGSDDTIDER
ncbi:Hypothetical protein D9617_218g064520 [Elsinoe fawcettii]|nr:Hypothetical protein D9617_218g064520 [Elsinoe fawcettii]